MCDVCKGFADIYYGAVLTSLHVNIKHTKAETDMAYAYHA